MLKWAIAKEDRRDSRNNNHNSSSSCNKSNPNSNNNSSSTKSLLRKRRKLSHSSLLLKDNNAEIELISGTKAHRNQGGGGGGGGYLKQHNQQRWNNGSSQLHHEDSKGLRTSHCRFNNNNTCKSGDHLTKTTASHNIHNGSHNGVINSSDSSDSPANNSTNADSKSLLYMSLDHLPLAIVKQYERMLQEQETEDNNNNNNDECNDYHDDDGVDDELEKRSTGAAVTSPTSATTTTITTTTIAPTTTTIKQGTKTKKSLSFTASTLPYRFKSKLSQSPSKKVILPLHGHGTTTTISAGTSKCLSHVSKSVKQTKPVTNSKVLLEPPEEECGHETRGDNLPAITTASNSIVTTASSSPSPLSVSSAGGGTEIIRHARSRSLRTCSFKTKVNDDNNEMKSISSSSPNNRGNRDAAPTTATTTMQAHNNEHYSSEKFYNLPLSPSHTIKSSTLPRARTQSTSSKSILKTISSQTTQTYKSILKNRLELNNNNFTTANQNSIIENLDIHSPIRRPFQSLLNVSTQCNPPTPVRGKTNNTQMIQQPQQPQLLKQVQKPQHHHQQKHDTEEEDDEDEESEEIDLRNELIERVKETSIPLPDHPLDPDHDTTDPQFLEKSLTFSFPAVTRCAKKLTLKRSELRKLERIRSHTDRLNRFLRKYYHECLPNLPEEEDSQCSPEEKSVSILRKHWSDESHSHSRPRRSSSNNAKLDHGSLTNLFNNTTTTTSSSSISSSCSSSSICSSSSSSDNDWRNYGHGSNSSHGTGNHNSNGSTSSRKSRQKRHARSVLSNNETTLLPIIQEDSAEVSSASVKSLESRIPEQAKFNRQANSSNGRTDPTLIHAHPTLNSSGPTLNAPLNAGPRLNPTLINAGPRLNAGSIPRTDVTRKGTAVLKKEYCLRGEIPLNDDDSIVDVKRDNMEDAEDHPSNAHWRNAIVTEGAGTDFLKLKGSFMSESEESPFDLPPTLPLTQQSLRNPQPSFTPPHPSPSSSTSLFHENTDNQSLTSTNSSHSHGYGSGSGTTIRTMDHADKSDDPAIVSHNHPLLPQQQLQHLPLDQQQQLLQLDEASNYQLSCAYYDEGIVQEDGNISRATVSSTMTTNANYPSETENETWNSHEYPSGSPCESSNEDERDEEEEGEEDTNQSHVEYSSFLLSQPKSQHLSSLINNSAIRMNDRAHLATHEPLKTPSPQPLVRQPRAHRQQDSSSLSDEDESLSQPGRGLMFSTPIRRILKTPLRKSTPRKLVKKPPVKSIFSGKGEVLIRTYSNGDYVTLHVVHAKNLQPSYRSSWKLAIKISLLPEAEATFTKSESVEVYKNRTWVKIDQKFSFEVAKNQLADQKIFLSFWKRQDRKTLFLGWTTLNLCSLSTTTSTSNNNNKTSQCWLKLRKRKMSATTTSAATYMPAAYNASQKMNGTSKGRTPSKPSPLPLEIETLEEVQTPESHDDDNNHFHHHHHPDEIKSQFPNSATMDSGVEDCCEPQVVQPSIDLDETQGKRISVKMIKHENQGYGFSVVWVSPPRIERLEKDKTADLAGLRIGDLIIGVNGEDVTMVPNTTIYHNMKTTGNELQLEVWRKNPPAPTPATVVKSNNPQIGSMVMMLMTGTGTGHNLPPKPTSPAPPPTHQSNVVNNNVGVVSSPRHAKQPSVPSSASTSTAHPSTTSPVVLTGNVNNDPTSSNNNSSHSHQNHHHHSHAGHQHQHHHPHQHQQHEQPHEHHHHQHHQQQEQPQQQQQQHHHHQHQQQEQPQQQQQQHHHHQHQQQEQPQQQQHHHQQQQPQSNPTTSNALPHSNVPLTTANINVHSNNPPIRVQLPPVSILKPPPPAPPTTGPPISPPLITSHSHLQRSSLMTKKLPAHPQPTLNSSSWRIRFNVELLDNEEDSLKQFFICELKFFRKVVAALDRYLIPAQANKLLTPQEIHSIFAHIITIITMTKRILQCVANGAPKTGWRLGEILFSTHSDHLSEITSAYSAYALNLGNSSLILGEKMTLQSFARFVLETPVPKGHLDITSLLFAPLEHLRNLCEICDEIVHHFDHWTDFSTQLKDCYANIVVRTDYMEPISHVSMKKHPLLSVRDLEKRIVSTSCQPMKVNEKGRKWLFGSRLFRREADGSWAPVWAFLFTDIIVLTSHMTRDRVFFVKETPIKLADVVTLHFNLPRKNENEFRLLFSPPEPTQSHYGRFDRILPIYRRPKSNQIILRTTNLQLKSMWKLLLQRQIITLNTRLSKSSSSNFSISEFCEKFPESNTASSRQEKIDEEPEEDDENLAGSITTAPNNKRSSATSNSIAGIESARQARSSNSATKDSVNTGQLGSKEQDQFKPLSAGLKLDKGAVGLPHSSGQIISGPLRQSEHVSHRLEESSKDSIIVEAAAPAVPSSSALIVDNTTTTTTSYSYSAVGKGIIKHPQSRTVQVPENQQLVTTDMREPQFKEGCANAREETIVAIRANITSKVSSTSPLAAASSRHCETTKPDPVSLPTTNNSHSDHHVNVNTEASLTLTDAHLSEHMANSASSEIHTNTTYSTSTATSSRLTNPTASNDKNNYTSPNRKLPTLELVTQFGEKRESTTLLADLPSMGSVTNKTNNSLPSSVGRSQGDKSKVNNGKFHQKPVEMLASPSEGSPSKSYLNSRKNSVRTETLINNNNESISDLNHNSSSGSSSDRRASLKEICECEGSADRPLKEEASRAQPRENSKEKARGNDDSRIICTSGSNNNNNDDESPVTMEKIRNFYTSILCTRDSFSMEAGRSDHSKRTCTMISTSFTDSTPTTSSCDKTNLPNSTRNSNTTSSNAPNSTTPNNTNDSKLTETNLSEATTTKEETLPKADELSRHQEEAVVQGETNNQADPLCQSDNTSDEKGRADDGYESQRNSKAIENDIVCIVSPLSPLSPSPASSTGKIMRGDLPGPKIMTNAILKSRQQEQIIMAAVSVSPTLSAIVGERVCEKPLGGDQKAMGIVKTVSKPIIPLTTTKIGLVERPPPSNESVVAAVVKVASIVSPGLVESGGIKRNVIAPSKMELERHPDSGSNSCAKGKVYANSPIVSGIGSERSRRRLLIDYKVRRDYPELFGITPRDRRSFIKRLGEKEGDSDKDLVAPYYYHTRLSPLPVLKNLQNGTHSPILAKDTDSDKGSDSTRGSDKCTEALPPTPICPPSKPKVSTSASTNTPPIQTATSNKSGLHHMKLMGSLEDEEDDASTSTGSITHSKRNVVSKARDDEVEEEVEDDDSDVSASGTNRNHVRDLIERPDEVHLHRRRRSPEESSSNDSGISEEILIVTEQGHQAKNASSSVGTEVSEEITLSTTSESEVKRRFPSTLREHEVISSTSTLNRCAVSSSSCSATSTDHAPTNSPSVHVPNKFHNIVDDNSSCNTTSGSCSSGNVVVNLTENSIEATLVEPDTHSSPPPPPLPDMIQANPPVLSSAKTKKTAHAEIHSSQSQCCHNNDEVDSGETSVSNSCETHPNSGTDCSTQSKMNHVCFVEGETTNGVDSMVELTKADKATGMEDDDLMDFSWVSRLPEKAYRNLLAERREAFFLANNHSFSDSPSSPYHHHHPPNYNRMNSNSSTLTTITSPSHDASSYTSASVPPAPPKEPLVVKIYEGGTVHNTIQPEPPSKCASSSACERVMYTRLEKQTTAHVERVESSDDSTSSSSDVASASPAAENGTTDPSWSSSSSSLAGYSSSIKEEPSPSTSAMAQQQQQQQQSQSSKLVNTTLTSASTNSVASGPSSSISNNGFYQKGILVSSFLDNRSRPEIVVTGDSPDHPKNGYLLQSDDDEEEEEQAISNSSIISNGRENQSGSSGRNEFLRVESNDSTAENYGDDDDYNFDDDDEELSHCSVATMNRYGTYESLEKIESDDALGTMPDIPRNMPRSKARFTFDDDDDDDDDDLFEEDFESDFNFRFPSQIQDNTYSVSRLGPLPPLLEEDYEDDMYEEHRAGSESPSNSTGEHSGSVPHLHNQVHQIPPVGQYKQSQLQRVTQYGVLR